MPSHLTCHLQHMAPRRPTAGGEDGSSRGSAQDEVVHTSDTTIITRAADGAPACLACGKVFSRPAHLRRHLDSHSDARIWPCQFCGTSFRRRYVWGGLESGLSSLGPGLAHTPLLTCTSTLQGCLESTLNHMQPSQCWSARGQANTQPGLHVMQGAQSQVQRQTALFYVQHRRHDMCLRSEARACSYRRPTGTGVSRRHLISVASQSHGNPHPDAQ